MSRLQTSCAFVTGVQTCSLPIWSDRSDRACQTRRSDVAFWLHLLAAPMISLPFFFLRGVTEGENITSGAAVMVVGIYIVFGLVALAIDRRALLVSALAYEIGRASCRERVCQYV